MSSPEERRGTMTRGKGANYYAARGKTQPAAVQYSNGLM